MRTILPLIIMGFLLGCTNPAIVKSDSYAATNKPLVAAGTMKWSDYYLGLYQIFAEARGTANQGLYMQIMNSMILISINYEEGRDSKVVFEAKQRDAEADMAKLISIESAAKRAALASAVKGYGDAVYGPEATRARQIPTQPLPIYQPPKQISCQTIGFQTTCTEQ